MLIQSPQTTKIDSLEDYRKLQETSEFKHEYHNGEIIAMTGGTLNHNAIIINLIFCLKLALGKTDNYIYSSDLRLWIPQYSRGVYPDIMVISGQPIFNENRTDEIINPCLIFEVLSPSTSSYDRGDKFLYYRSIPQFKEYILISQSDYLIEHYTKINDHQWLLQDYQDQEGIIHLNSVNIDLKISDVYDNLKI
ncbi:Uma2 family endonuclease [Crocosphaera sp. XPORK-15E]|uniref:Uma2 family endonuclease n=1 Tax=Crocosphaera sp. XPORK-15E TaxID=3110247 RepID=UPI002B20FB3C|nr:Uma2 family endonuclease [Crocosphaera sp. XPORK-15E]MEA5534029.1 Uma2 family endonuclease [Crocosphaera sp. XPORK-15E]